MYKYTDCRQELQLEDVDLTGARVLWATYSQFGREIFTKDEDDVDIEGQSVYVHLTQEDTGLLTGKYPVLIQLRLLLSDGEAYTTEIVKRNVKDVLKAGVMSEEVVPDEDEGSK